MKPDKKAWSTRYADGEMSLLMPEGDAEELDRQALKAGVSTEVYIRRSLGLPDEPTS